MNRTLQVVSYYCDNKCVSANLYGLPEHDRSSLASVPLPPSDDFYSAPQENETGGAFHDIADPEQPELSDQTSENDGDIFDLEDLEDIDQAQEADQDHATKQDHGASDLPADMNHLSNEGDYEVQNGLTTSSLSKEASKGNSDIDDDEITYDDEDAEDSIRANHGDVEGTNRPGNSPRPESNHEGIDHENGTSGGQRESLKRLRPEKDEEPAQGDDTQGTRTSDDQICSPRLTNRNRVEARSLRIGHVQANYVCIFSNLHLSSWFDRFGRTNAA